MDLVPYIAENVLSGLEFAILGLFDELVNGFLVGEEPLHKECLGEKMDTSSFFLAR